MKVSPKLLHEKQSRGLRSAMRYTMYDVPFLLFYGKQHKNID